MVASSAGGGARRRVVRAPSSRRSGRGSGPARRHRPRWSGGRAPAARGRTVRPSGTAPAAPPAPTSPVPRAGLLDAAISAGSADFSSSAGGGGTVAIQLAEPVLLVQQVEDVDLGVLELGAPVQRVERADLDADAAVHAQAEVDGEAVEHVALALAAALGGGRDRLLVRVDVDAPVGALAGAEHARGAVLLEQRDDPAAARRQVGRDVGVLGGVGRPQRGCAPWSTRPLRMPGSPLPFPLTIRAPPRRRSASAGGGRAARATARPAAAAGPRAAGARRRAPR